MTTPGVAAPSPYELVLGDDMRSLHPRLRTYFSAVPAGMIGVGHGVFDTVGSPRRWLWPVYRVLAADGIIFPVWQQGVEFEVRNVARPGPALGAEREFRFARGTRTMTDEIAVEAGRLVDRLGRSGRLIAECDLRSEDGALHLESTGLVVVVAGLRLRVPRFLAPTVTLTERFDDTQGQQRVTLVVRHPVLGTLYQYAGRFTYELRPGGVGA